MMTAHRPFAGVVLAFSLGILTCRFTHSSLGLWAGLTLLFLFLSLIFFKKKSLAAIFIFGSLIFLGTVFTQIYQYLPSDHIVYKGRYYKKAPVFVEGIVVSDVQKRIFFKSTKTSFTLELIDFCITNEIFNADKRKSNADSRRLPSENLRKSALHLRPSAFNRCFRNAKINKQLKTKWGWRKTRGKILVNIFRDAAAGYGDRLILEGKMHQPFNFSTQENVRFNYKDYLSRQGIYRILSVKKDSPLLIVGSNEGNFLMGLSLKIKKRFRKVFTDNLSFREASIMQAIVLGDRYDIPKHVNELFVKTGTAHILAISGFNVGITAFFVFLILKLLPVGRRAQYILTMMVLIGYAFLTGFRPPVVRATIMAVVFLLSFLLERETDTVNSLSLAAMIILMINPLNLLDVSFQLSFASVLAIILVYPSGISWLLRWPLMRRQPFLFLGQSMVVSLAAWVGVAGLITYYFHIVTPVTVLANLVVIPCISIVNILGLGLLVVGTIPVFCVVFAACIKLVLNLTVACIYGFAQLPAAYFYIKEMPPWAVWGYYAVVLTVFAIVGFWVKKKTVKRIDEEMYTLRRSV